MRPIKCLIKLLFFVIIIMSLMYFIDKSNLNNLNSQKSDLHNSDSNRLDLRNILGKSNSLKPLTSGGRNETTIANQFQKQDTQESEFDSLDSRKIEGRSTTLKPVTPRILNKTTTVKQEVSQYLKWTQNTNSFPYRDSSGLYSIHPYVWTAGEWPKRVVKEYTVSLATHCTVSHIHHIVKLSSYWTGLISVSVYTPAGDAVLAQIMIETIRRCYPNVKKYVTFHFVYPIGAAAFTNFKDLNLGPSDSYLHCGDAKEINARLFQLYNKTGIPGHGIRYPQNLMRNVARSSAPTSHCITSDVDMIPSELLCSKLTTYLRSHKNACEKCVYVLPVYELSSDQKIVPQDKKKLLELVKEKKAQQYHIEVYSKNQGNSHLERWEKKYSKDSSKVSVMYTLKKYTEFWEPISMIHASAPPFEERFVGYGFTRSSHVYLLFKMGYGFGVMDETFFTHMGFQKKNSYPKYRMQEIDENRKRYRTYKEEIKARYRKR